MAGYNPLTSKYAKNNPLLQGSAYHKTEEVPTPELDKVKGGSYNPLTSDYAKNNPLLQQGNTAWRDLLPDSAKQPVQIPELDKAVGNTPALNREPTRLYDKASDAEIKAAQESLASALDDAIVSNWGGKNDAEIKRLRGIVDAINKPGADKSTLLAEFIVDDPTRDQSRRQEMLESKASKEYKDTFFGQFGANRRLGQLSQEISKAWSDYIANPTQESRAYAEAASKAAEDFQKKNTEALDDENAKATLLTKDLAGNLPQFGDQLGAKAVGGAVGSVFGAKGAKVGAAVVSGAQSAELMKGAAFKTLIDLGIDEDIALKAASDEAFLSGLLESADTLYDLASYGTGELVNTLFKGSTKAAAKTGAPGVLWQLVKGLGKYGISIPEEGLQEGLQQAISMANADRLEDGELDGGKLDLAKRALSLYWDRLRGEASEEDTAEIKAAEKGGMRLAALLGGVEMVGANVANRAVQQRQEQTSPLIIEQEQEQAGLDSNQTVWYGDHNNEQTGGMPNVGTGSAEDSGAGVAGVQTGVGDLEVGGEQPSGISGDSSVVRISPELNTAYQNSGVVPVELRDSTADSAAFSYALSAARDRDAANGWAVTPKSAEELDADGVRTMMTAGGGAGAGVTQDGDIVAVFKNKEFGPPKALHSILPAAIDAGGCKLDCYGVGLVNVYAQYGFIPVCRVEFNPEYANPGWTPDKGTPDIYFMVYAGKNGADSISKFGTRKVWITADLDVLPFYGKDAYDEAYAYRDSLLPERSSNPMADTLLGEEQLDVPISEQQPAGPSMETQSGVFGKSVGAATARQGPQVETQSKVITEANWLSEEERASIPIETHERVGKALREARAGEMFIADSSGKIINAKDVSLDLLDMAEGTWDDVAQQAVVRAAQSPDVKADESLFQRLTQRLIQERTADARAMRAGQDWMAHTPIGKVAEATRVVDAARKEAKGGKATKAAEEEVAAITQQIEASVPEAAAAAADSTAYDLIHDIYLALSESTRRKRKEASVPEAAAAAADSTAYDLIHDIYLALSESTRRKRKGSFKQNRNWVVQLADALSDRIDPEQKQPKTKKLAQAMLEDLVRLTKEVAPPAQKSFQGNFSPNTETFQNFLENRAEYERAVRWAQQNIAQKYADNPEQLQFFQDWLNNGISLSNVLNGVIREHGVNINEILRQSWDDKAKAVNEIKNNILANTSLTDQQRAEAAEMIHGRFWGEVMERSRSSVEKYVAPRTEGGPGKSASQQFEELVNLGALDMIDLKDAVLDRVVRFAVRENSKALSEIVSENMDNKAAAVQEITNQVLGKADLTPEQRAETAAIIYDKLMAEVSSRGEKRVEQYLEPSKRGKPTPLMDRFVQLYNEGGFSKDALREAVYEKLGLPVLSATDTNQIYSLMEKSMALRETDPRTADKLEQQANKIIASKVPVKFRTKLVTGLMDGMLTGFKTLISRNAGGNVVFGAIDTLAKYPTALVDTVTSAWTKERYYATPDAEYAKAYGKGFAKGVKETVEDFKWDVHTARSGETVDYKAQIKPFSNWAAAGLDKIVRTGLEIGDRPFYEAAYAARLAELNKLRDAGKLSGDLLEHFNDLAPVEARLAALDAVFQSKGQVGKGFNDLRSAVQNIVEGMTGIGLGGQLTIPFTQTPGNILQRAAEYIPGLGTVKNIIKTGSEISQGKFDQRRFSREAGRNLTGLGVAGLALAGAASGMLTGGNEDDELAEQAGIQEYSVKIGDKYFSYDWLAVLGSVLAGTVDFYNALDDGEETPLLNAVGQGLETVADQTMLGGVSRMFGGYGGVVGGIGESLLQGTSQAIPQTVRRFARTADEYERSTYDPNKIKQQWNYMKSGIPGLRETLPMQYDLFGNPIETSQGRGVGSRIAENYINPFYLSEEQDNPRTKELLRLRDAGYDVSISEIPKKLDFDGDGKNDALSSEEYAEYSRIRGETLGEILAGVIDSDAYKAMSDEDKQSVANRAKDYANYVAKVEAYRARGEEYKVDNWVKEAMASSDPAKYIQVYSTTKNLEPLPGNDSVKKYQELESVVNNCTAAEADEWLPGYFSDMQNRKYKMARERGYSPERIVELYTAYNLFDTGENKRGRAVQWLIDEKGWPQNYAEELYDLWKVTSSEKLDDWSW